MVSADASITTVSYLEKGIVLQHHQSPFYRVFGRSKCYKNGKGRCTPYNILKAETGTLENLFDPDIEKQIFPSRCLNDQILYCNNRLNCCGGKRHVAIEH